MSNTACAPRPRDSVANGLGRAVPGQHHVVGAAGLGQLERLGALVHGDDPGLGGGPEDLDGQVAEPADADHHRGAPRHQEPSSPSDGVIGRQRRVGERGRLGRAHRVGQRHQVAQPGNEHELGHAAVRAQPTDRGAQRRVLAVVLLAEGAGAASATAPGSVDGDRLAHLQAARRRGRAGAPSRRSRDRG